MDGHRDTGGDRGHLPRSPGLVPKQTLGNCQCQGFTVCSFGPSPPSPMWPSHSRLLRAQHLSQSGRFPARGLLRGTSGLRDKAALTETHPENAPQGQGLCGASFVQNVVTQLERVSKE